MNSVQLDLIGLGECMVELYADQPLGSAPSLTKAYGGDVLNALVMASRLGSQTGFITRVGNDPFGPGLLEAWQSEGVDVAQAPLVEGENGVYFISLLAGGEREFTYRRAGSAASQIGPEDLNPAYIAGARILLLSGITQAVSESAQATTLEAARMAKTRGVQVAYDPNYRPRLWGDRGGLEAARAAFTELLPYVDILLPSFPADAVLAEDELANAQSLMQHWASEVQLVALKQGEEGAILAQAGRIELMATQPVKVVDSTGAGDVWNGAFLHGLSQHQPPDEAALLAHRMAAWKLGFRGAIPREQLPER